MSSPSPRFLPALVIAAGFLSASPTASAGERGGMAYPAGEWERAAPEDEGLDPAALEAAIRFLEENAGKDGVRELVIVRRGRLVHEGTDAGKRHGIWSGTKSFTSTVLGLLTDDGKCEVDDPASRHDPSLAETYPQATLRHFTTMTSGYLAEGDEPRGDYRHGPSKTPFLPNPAPLFTPPGSAYAYWDSAMNEFANVLGKIAGEPIEELFERRIARPIGLARERWSWGDFGRVDGLRVNGGAGNHGNHVKISARELARFGHLFLNRGRWNDRQLLGADWVDRATGVQVPASFPLRGVERIDGRGVYGFNWWVNGIGPDGRRKWPGAPPGTFAASGYNNNDLFVVPEWELVAVRLGLDEGDRKITDGVYGEFLRRIGEALTDLPTRPDEWRVASQREEILPASWRDRAVRLDGEPTLALAGRGSDAVNGRWERVFPVKEGTHVLFESRYLAARVDEPLRCVLARILWLDGEGRGVARPEYPATSEADDGEWSLIGDTYTVPGGATTARVELALRWDGDGVVRFGGARLEEVPPPAPRKVRLAAVHHRPRGSAGPRENVEAFVRFVARAAERKADVVCLPEGITVVGTGKSYLDVAEPVPGPTTRELGEAARKHGVYIVAGIYEKDGARLYNTAVLLAPSGKLAGKYRKVCLPREEIEGGITPGKELPVFDTPFGRIGMMICWDVFFPEPARKLAAQGAEVIFLPIWGGDMTLARARAIENQVYLVTSTYDMKTAVVDRRGKTLAEGSDDDPVIVVEVDLAERELWPWLGDFRRRIPRERPTERALR